MAAITLAASAARTASGEGTGVDLGAPFSFTKLRLSVSVVAGTLPTLTIVIKTSSENTFYWTHTTFPVVNAIGVYELSLAGLDQYVKAVWTITGSVGQSFTFSLLGTSQVVYSHPSELLVFSGPSAAFGTISPNDRAEAILAATSLINSYLQQRYTLPLSVWGKDIRRACALLAAYDLLLSRGIFRDESQQKNLQLQYDQIIKWLEKIRDGIVTPDGMVDATPEVNNGGGVLYTRAKRGWGAR